MTNENKAIAFTKEQWESIIYHVMNDASMLEMGLCAQAGKDAVNKITGNALDISNKIKETIGSDIDLSEWEFIYRKNNNDSCLDS